MAATALAIMQYGISKLVQSRTRADAFAIAFILCICTTEVYNSIELHHPVNAGSIALWILAYLSSWPARLATQRSDGFESFAISFSLPAVAVSLIAVAQMMRVDGVNELLLKFVNTSGLEQRLTISRDIRATSLIGHQIGLGAYLCSILALLGSALILRHQRMARKRIASIIWLTSFVGQLATVTFATTGIALAVAAATALKLRIRMPIIAGAVLAAAVGWAIFGSFISQRFAEQTSGVGKGNVTYAILPETIGFRLDKWVTETIPAAMQRPLTGWGYGVYESSDNRWPVTPNGLKWMSPESEWFRTLISAGIPALALQLMMITSIYATTFVGSSSAAYRSPLKVFFIGLICASIIHNHLTGPGTVVSLWALLGAIWGYGGRPNDSAEMDRQQPRDTRS